jgi:hypothetical protein
LAALQPAPQNYGAPNIFFFYRAKAQRRKEILIRSVRLPEAFAPLRLCAHYYFFLAKPTYPPPWTDF